jgi:hypothetical protein
MKNPIIILILLLSFNTLNAQKTYKRMMEDPSINFYEVCNEADKYFETHDPKVKGSGFKPYQRWKNANEYKYFPSGDRSKTDPFFPENAYNSFLENNPQSKYNTNLVAPGAPPSPYNNGWRELGPFSLDSITGHYAAGLGRIEDHYVNPTNANIMYVGSRSGGFWRTTDGGNNWQVTTDFLVASGVNAIAVSPTNSDSVLINVRNSRNGNSHGLYRSVDGGLTWTQSNFNPINLGNGGLGSSWQINKVKYHPRVANLVFITASDGLYRSTDNLETWTKITSGSISEIEFHPTNNNVVYIYDYYYWNPNKNVVLRSVDQGISFNPSSTVVGNNDNGSVHFSVSTECSDCLYWASDNGIWKSIDNGINFTFLSNPSESCGGFAVNDLDTTKMIYGYVDIDRSTDGGKTFTDATFWALGNTNGTGGTNQSRFQTATNYVHADLHPAKCVNGVFYVGTDGLFAKSVDNGANWIVIGQGLAVRENYKLGASQSNHHRSISGSQDNGTSIKHKDTWIEFNGGDGMECLIHPLNDDWFLGSYQYGSRYLSKNGGQNIIGITPSGQGGSGNGAWEAPIAYDPNNQMTLYNFSHYIYKSEDFGTSWDSISAPTTFTGTIGHAAIAEINSNIIIIASGDNIEKSINGGATFIDIKGTLPSSSIQDIAFDPNDDNTIIVVYASYQNNSEKVYRSTDGGNTWNNITFNLGNMPIRSVVIDHLNASNIYLGAEIGIFTMPMNATTWVLYNPNLPNCTVEELEVVNGSNTLKGATWGRGMWEYTLVGRNDFPSIITTKITHQPTESLPKENVDQFVTSTISYPNTLSNVFVKWSTDTAIFNNTIIMTNTVDSTWVSNTAIPNQVFGTKIFFKVFAIGNNNDTTETYKFMYRVKENIYCPSTGTMVYQGNVTQVDFNTINKFSGKTSPYSDYTNTDSTNVIKGNSYNIAINLNTDGGNYRYYATAWIDWNQDLDFDATEEYQIGYAQNVSNMPTDLSPLTITVPTNALSGKTRMRVVCKYNSYQSDPCATGTDGEVEDYTIIVIPSPELDFSITESEICENEKIHFSYTGDSLTNILWSFSNGVNTFSSTNTTDSLNIPNSGTYSLNLSGILSGINAEIDTNSLFIVNAPSFASTNLTTCDSTNVGTTIDTLTNSVGCDSILTTITSLTTINPTISITTNELTALPSGLAYQWLNCEPNLAPIIGANNQTFIVSTSGSYAVEIQDGACVETSSCEQITGVGIIENNFENEIKLYPNPTNGLLTLELDGKFEEIAVSVTNDIGQLVFSSKETSSKFNIDLTNNSSGIYFLQLESKDKKALFKVLKDK